MLLAKYLRGEVKQQPTSPRTIAPLPLDAVPQLSFAQERLWFLNQLNPGSAVYNGVEPGRPAGPADVDMAGGLSPYGTMGQDGNVYEWSESAFDGSNDLPDESHVIRGGYWNAAEQNLRSSDRVSIAEAGSGAGSGGVGVPAGTLPAPASSR